MHGASCSLGLISHNTSWIGGTGSTPYEITFVRKPFNFPEYVAGTSKVDVVEEILTEREEIFRSIRKKLLKAQDAIKCQANRKCRHMHYQEDDWVLVKLRPHRQTSTKGAQAVARKLAKRYYGPFQV